MPARNEPTLLKRIASAPRLTPSERALAEFYEHSLPEAALLNLREVCQATAVSGATVARFARTLGYADFRDLSQSVRAELRSTLRHPGDRLSHAHTVADVLGTRLTQVRSDLDASLATLDPEVFDRVADLLSDERRPVYLAAVASGRPLLEHFAILASYLRGGVTVLPGTDLWAHALAGMPAGSAVLASTVDRTPAPVDTLLRLARRRGATTVLLTNRHSNPLAALADLTLLTSTRSDAVFRTRTPLLATLEALLDAMAQRCPHAAERAADVEEYFRLSHGYLDT